MRRNRHTHESAQKRKPDLQDGHDAKLACGGEYDGECSCELVFLIGLGGGGGGGEGVEVVAKACWEEG